MRTKQSKGMTLIELMIVVAIMAIIAMVAYPSYTDYVIRSHRAEGQVTLVETAQALERCFTAAGTYVGCVASPFDTEGGYYRITVNTPSASTFTLTATPIGAQTKDTKCGNLGLDETGAKSAGGSLDDCW